MPAPTMKDVAKMAGVSLATASRGLSGNPHINADTRQRVLDAAAALSYRPDQVARSLRRRRTDLIGFVVSTIENVFFTELARGAELAARRRGYSLIICNTDESPELEEAYVSILDRLLVAGIILAPARGEGNHLRPFAAAGLPMVLVNRRLDHLGCTSITADDEEGAYQCVHYLIETGKRRVAAITGLEGISTTEQRLQGYRRALAEAGLSDCSPECEMCGEATVEGGYRATRELACSANPPDGYFAFNNLMTQGAVMALADLGLERPAQVDVAGFGAFPSAKLYRPPVMLVSQPTYEMGARAVDLLVDRAEAAEPAAPEAIVLPNKLLLPEALALAK
jgi:LacI family transcriptional regulator